MKIKNLLYILVAAIGFSACNDDDSPVLPQYEASVLKVPTQTEYILLQDNQDEEAFSLEWTSTEQDELLVGPPTYCLQMDIHGKNFTSTVATILAKTSEHQVSINVKDLNDMLKNTLMLAGNETYEIDFRIVTSLGLNTALIESSASNVLTFSIRTYTEVSKEPAKLYVPGDHNGWTHSQFIQSVDKEKTQFEGYFFLNGGFKFSNVANWDGTNYGAGDEAGVLAIPGKDIKLEESVYFLTVDITTLKWTHQAVTWGLIGSATPGDWNTDTPLTYDVTTNTLIATVTLIDGEIKFRRDGAWDVDLGTSAEVGAGELVLKGGNIPVKAGKYLISLDVFSSPTEFSYTMTPLE